MCTLQDRLRCVLQRNKAEATAPCPCGNVQVIQRRYQDARGRVVTVVSAGRKKITYRYEGYESLCEISREKFYKKFKQVEV